jgi:hypothetical protein
LIPLIHRKDIKIEDRMASTPQIPETSHKKDISAVSVRTIGREIGEEGQRDLEDQPAGRRRLEPLSLKTNLGRVRSGVELMPKPSDDARDPLVRLLS